jgi:hypothetical protein
MVEVFLCVILFHRNKLWKHSITSHFCSTTYIMQLDRSIQKWLKMPSSYVILSQPRQHTLLRMFSGTGSGKC